MRRAPELTDRRLLIQATITVSRIHAACTSKCTSKSAKIADCYRVASVCVAIAMRNARLLRPKLVNEITK